MLNKSRFNYGILFLIVVIIFLITYYLEYVSGIHPCPLCLLQRLCFYIVGFIFLIACIHSPKNIGNIVYPILTIIFSLIGIVFAIRQIYLQHLPQGQTVGCGVDLAYMFQNFPITEALKHVFQGSAECAVSQWHFLGFDMAEWALLWFIFFIAISVFLIVRCRQWKK